MLAAVRDCVHCAHYCRPRKLFLLECKDFSFSLSLAPRRQNNQTKTHLSMTRCIRLQRLGLLSNLSYYSVLISPFITEQTLYSLIDGLVVGTLFSWSTFEQAFGKNCDLCRICKYHAGTGGFHPMNDKFLTEESLKTREFLEIELDYEWCKLRQNNSQRRYWGLQLKHSFSAAVPRWCTN